MWKKEEGSTGKENPKAVDNSSAQASERVSRTSGPEERATIGRSISIQGDVTGDEDLLIQGRVDGAVSLREHSVTVGPEGEVHASIVGRVVTIEGRVEGNLTAEEQVFLRASARVKGDILAPRVVLEDGARFLGSIDMGDASERDKQRSRPNSTAQRQPGSQGAGDVLETVGKVPAMAGEASREGDGPDDKSEGDGPKDKDGSASGSPVKVGK